MSKIEELFESYWAGVMQDKQPTYKLFHWHHKNGFMAGANAVLEEIEKLRKSLGDNDGFHYNFYVGVLKLVEQLKKG